MCAAASSRVTRNSSRPPVPWLIDPARALLRTPLGSVFPVSGSPVVPRVVPPFPLPVALPDPNDYFIDVDTSSANQTRWHWSTRKEFAQTHAYADACVSTMKRYATELDQDLEDRRLANFIRDAAAGFSADERRRFNLLTHFSALPADVWNLGNLNVGRTGRANATAQHKIIAWAKVHGITAKDKSEAKSHLRQKQAYLYQASREAEPWITALYDVCEVAEASVAEVQEYVIEFASSVLPENMSSERSIQKVAAAEFSNDPGVAPTTRQAMKDRLMAYETEIDRLARSAVYNKHTSSGVPSLFPPTEGEYDQVKESDGDVMALTDAAAEDWYAAMQVPKEMQERLTPVLGSNEGRASQTMSVRDTAEAPVQDYDPEYVHDQSMEAPSQKGDEAEERSGSSTISMDA